MDVTILSQENTVNLAGKNLYCYGFVKSNLEELLSSFTIKRQIAAILEDNPKWQNQYFESSYSETPIPVFSPSVLQQETAEDIVIIITADYPEEVLEQFGLLSFGARDMGLLYLPEQEFQCRLKKEFFLLLHCYQL